MRSICSLTFLLRFSPYSSLVITYYPTAFPVLWRLCASFRLLSLTRLLSVSALHISPAEPYLSPSVRSSYLNDYPVAYMIRHYRLLICWPFRSVCFQRFHSTMSQFDFCTPSLLPRLQYFTWLYCFRIDAQYNQEYV